MLILYSYYLWFGQAFHSREPIELAVVESVSTPRDALSLRTDFDSSAIERVFRLTFPNSGIVVHEIVNLVYVARRFVSSPTSTEKTTVTRLY